MSVMTCRAWTLTGSSSSLSLLIGETRLVPELAHHELESEFNIIMNMIITYLLLVSGQIVGYDLRGGSTAARALGSQGQHPAVVEVAVRQALMQVPELEQQTSIVRSAVQSLNLDPVDPNRLAFHLQSGWSGEPHTHCTQCHNCLLRAAEHESMCINSMS